MNRVLGGEDIGLPLHHPPDIRLVIIIGRKWYLLLELLHGMDIGKTVFPAVFRVLICLHHFRQQLVLQDNGFAALFVERVHDPYSARDEKTAFAGPKLQESEGFQFTAVLIHKVGHRACYLCYQAILMFTHHSFTLQFYGYHKEGNGGSAARKRCIPCPETMHPCLGTMHPMPGNDASHVRKRYITCRDNTGPDFRWICTPY